MKVTITLRNRKELSNDDKGCRRVLLLLYDMDYEKKGAKKRHAFDDNYSNSDK